LEGATAGWAAREGRPVVREVAEYPPGRLRELLAADRIQIVISTPLLFKGRTVGAMDLGTTCHWIPTPEALSLLTAIGHQVGVAVENARLYEQAQQLAVVQERNRLARDLHDSVTQALYGVTLCAEAAARQLSSGDPDPSIAARHLREIKETTQSALREMRLLIFELRPPILNREGLAPALQARLDAVERRFGLDAQFIGDGDGRWAPEVEDGVYRIAQEALNNVLKHACARRVEVRLVQGQDCLSLEITDDGTGFDPETATKHGGFGLRSMRERAKQIGGTLCVESGPGKGTRIRMEVRR
jgi:signal transduction histidine kinase